MKKLLLLLLFIPTILFAQVDVNRTNPVGNNSSLSSFNKQSVRDANLTAVFNLRIPVGPTNTLNNAKDSIGYIRFNTTTNKLVVYKGGGVWDTYTTSTDASGYLKRAGGGNNMLQTITFNTNGITRDSLHNGVYFTANTDYGLMHYENAGTLASNANLYFDFGDNAFEHNSGGIIQRFNTGGHGPLLDTVYEEVFRSNRTKFQYKKQDIINATNIGSGLLYINPTDSTNGGRVVVDPSLYVPFTGAGSNVDLGPHNISATNFNGGTFNATNGSNISSKQDITGFTHTNSNYYAGVSSKVLVNAQGISYTDGSAHNIFNLVNQSFGSHNLITGNVNEFQSGLQSTVTPTNPNDVLRLTDLNTFGDARYGRLNATVGENHWTGNNIFNYGGSQVYIGPGGGSGELINAAGTIMANYFTIQGTGAYTFGAGQSYFNNNILVLHSFGVDATGGTDINMRFFNSDNIGSSVIHYDRVGHVLDLNGSRIATVSDLTGGTITSVSGTTNRITSTGGTTPVIDIASTYAGQSSINTVGTINTGIWQGSPIADAYISSSSYWNAKQDALSGTGFVKSAAGVISYDTNTYLTTSSASSTYVPLTGGTSTGTQVIQKTGEQLRLGYDASNYISFVVNPTGTIDITSTGGLIRTPGQLSIGTNSSGGTNVFVTRNISGAPTGFGIYSGGVTQSDVTTSVNYFQTAAGTQATTFTLGGIVHYNAAQGTIGAGSTVNTQAAFWGQSSLTGATNNYIFRGSLAAATGRWNTYNDGTAQNYMAGNLGLGILAATAYLNIKAGTATAGTAPIKLTTGVNLTAAEAGAIEFNGTDLFYTTSTPTRRTIVNLDAAQVLTNKDLTGVGNTFPIFNQPTTGNAGTVTNGVYTTTFNGLGDARYPLLSGGYVNPTWITSLPSTKITGLGTLATQNGTFSGTSSGTNTGDETTTRINALYGYTPANGVNYLALHATADNSSQWNGFSNSFGGTILSGVVSIPVIDGTTTIKTASAGAIQTFLGLGSNAYTSASYSPLQSFYSDAAASSTATDVYSFLLPANSLNVNGNFVDAEYDASFAWVSGVGARLIISFGGQSIYDSGNYAATGFSPVTFRITRTGTTTARVIYGALVIGGWVQYSNIDLTGVDFTTSNIIKANIVAPTGSTLTMKTGKLLLYKQ